MNTIRLHVSRCIRPVEAADVRVVYAEIQIGGPVVFGNIQLRRLVSVLIVWAVFMVLNGFSNGGEKRMTPPN
jgi:hypothetical protein